MIIDKVPLPEDEDINVIDAPPSYDTISPSNNGTYGPAGSSSKGRMTSPSLSTLSQSITSTSSISPISPKSVTLPNPNKGKGRASGNSWFSFGTSRTAREVRITVLGLVRDLIQEYNTSTDASNMATHGILQSCADACATNDISLSTILQEKSIENHSPLYWAIVKRFPDGHRCVEAGQGPDFLSILISYAAPLTPDTVREVRLACLAMSDQKLFQRLRMTPQFTPVSGKDQMLLGISMSPDEVEVEELPGEAGLFTAKFVIPHFHKRMVVSKQVVLEFIARNRMWKLSFFVAHSGFSRPGAWYASLQLQENSPSTFVDSRLVLEVESSPQPISPPESLIGTPDTSPSPTRSVFKLSSLMGSPIPPTSDLNPKPNATIEVRMGSQFRLEPDTPTRTNQCINRIYECLESTGIQYANSLYISKDEALRGRFEASLATPQKGNECIVC